jgi:diguanylate cyclase (GGDEF)-like protein
MESVSQPASDAVFNALTFDQNQRDALTDPVTGLANMRIIASQFYRDRARSQRRGTTVSMLVVRLDNLDEAASALATSNTQLLMLMGVLIRQQVRETDLVGRNSTSAFTVLLPDSGRSEASRVNDRIRSAIEKAGLDAKLSVSIGWAVSPDDGTTMDEVLQAAYLDCVSPGENIGVLALLDRDAKLTVGSA